MSLGIVEKSQKCSNVQKWGAGWGWGVSTRVVDAATGMSA